MNCPWCNAKSKTKETRQKEGMTFRRHECLECHKRFTTYELYADNYRVLKGYAQIMAHIKKQLEEKEKNDVYKF